MIQPARDHGPGGGVVGLHEQRRRACPANGGETEPAAGQAAAVAGIAFIGLIGHQNNTLILGPGGFRFGDYWRLGIALELIVVLVAVPMLLVAAVKRRWFPPLQKGG